MGKGGSFWSSIPGFLTGLAGVLTAVVTLVTLAFSQGWVGDSSPGDTGGPSGAGGGEAAAASAPEVSVDPDSLSFRPTIFGSVTEALTVINAGDQPFTVDATQLTGDDPERFEVDDDACTAAPLPSGRTCTLDVTFDPSGIGDARATLVVSVNGGEGAAEVALGAAGLG